MNDLRSTARFVEREPRSSLILATLRDRAVVRETIRSTAVVSKLRETAALDDRATGAALNDLRDRAQLSDAAHPRVRARRDVRDTAMVRDRLEGRVRAVQDVRDSAVVCDWLHAPRSVFDLRDSGRLGDAVHPFVRRRQDVRETARLRDRLQARALGDLRDSLSAADRVSPRVRHRPVLRDAGRLADRLDGVALLRDVLRSRGAIRDRVTPRLIHRPVVRERAFISGDIEERSDIAWTANTLTWAMSRYDGFAFESLAGGFAAGADGVHVPGDGVVPWRFETGRTDFGAPEQKRLSYLYTVGTHDAPLGIRVSGDVRGRWTSADYEQMAREADDDRAVRCTVGRGFLSNRYQLAVSGVAPAKVLHAEVMAHAGQRRI